MLMYLIKKQFVILKRLLQETKVMSPNFTLHQLIDLLNPCLTHCSLQPTINSWRAKKGLGATLFTGKCNEYCLEKVQKSSTE